jgi:hypothetical protein
VYGALGESLLGVSTNVGNGDILRCIIQSCNYGVHRRYLVGGVALEFSHRATCPPILFTASDGDILAVEELDMLLIGFGGYWCFFMWSNLCC